MAKTSKTKIPRMAHKIKSGARTLIDTTRDGIYLNRELSQLAFNRRVLAQAMDKNVPLLERLRYLCIVSSNLDEFFEVRIASLLAQNQIDGERNDSPRLAEAQRQTSIECHQIVALHYAILNDEVLPQLSAQGIHLLRHEDRNEAQRAWVKAYFEQQVRPLLTPIGLDPSHPFPQVVNKSLNFIVELTGKDAFGRQTAIAIVKAPRVLPRVIQLPAELSTRKGVAFCLLTSVIHAHIADLFSGREVMAYSQFRVTRNSDLWVDEEEVKNLRQALQSELQSRQFGVAVRLEVATQLPAASGAIPAGPVRDRGSPAVCGQRPGQHGAAGGADRSGASAGAALSALRPRISGAAGDRGHVRAAEEKGCAAASSVPVVPAGGRLHPRRRA